MNKEKVVEDIKNKSIVKPLDLSIIYSNSLGCKFKIINGDKRSKLTVQFDDGYIVKNICLRRVLKGEIQNPYYKSKYGVGFLGEGKYKVSYYKNNPNIIFYNRWNSMFERCYNEKQPTYKDCFVTGEWHNFQNFAKWFEENYNSEYMKGWHLDKDILVKGNKVYSPETCCFVPHEINNIFIKSNTKRGDLPIGVSLRKKEGTYMTTIRKNGRSLNLGTFITPEEAFQAYKIAKEQHIKEIADKWKGKISEEVYQAMYNYKVEITD